MTGDGQTPSEALSLVYVIGTYPLLTTTFIDREVELVRARGVDLRVISIQRPYGFLSAEQEALAEDVEYVMPVGAVHVLASNVRWLFLRPLEYLGTLWELVSAPHRTVRQRGRTFLHVGLGAHIASLLSCRRHDHIHAHFVDRATVVAMVVGRLLGLPYSATAHANDIYVDPVLLPEKTRRAAFLVTCTEANARHLERTTGEGARIRTIYHGLDIGSFPPQTRSGEARQPRLVSVGQLKEKKGLVYLVEACRLLAQAGRDFKCTIVGEGPERGRLEDAIEEAGVGGMVTLMGAQSHEVVREQLAASDVFVLSAVTAGDGDRDGIPNVILEAMASGLPVVSTAHSGIPEAVVDGYTGLLVAPGDARLLATAIASLLDAPGLRAKMGAEGRRRVGEVFDIAQNVDALLKAFMA